MVDAHAPRLYHGTLTGAALCLCGGIWGLLFIQLHKLVRPDCCSERAARGADAGAASMPRFANSILWQNSCANVMAAERCVSDCGRVQVVILGLPSCSSTLHVCGTHSPTLVKKESVEQMQLLSADEHPVAAMASPIHFPYAPVSSRVPMLIALLWNVLRSRVVLRLPIVLQEPEG